MMDTSLFLKSESGIRNICKLYVLSSKGTKFHPGCNHSQEITIEIKSLSIWHGGLGVRTGFNTSSHLVRFPAEHFFSRRGWIYFILHGFRIVLHTICFLLIYFSMKFMYNVNRTSSDGRIAPSHFCWATLTGKDKQ